MTEKYPEFVFMINIFFLSILLIGVYEALELRDGGSDYLGKGVSKVGYRFVHLLRIGVANLVDLRGSCVYILK